MQVGVVIGWLGHSGYGFGWIQVARGLVLTGFWV